MSRSEVRVRATLRMQLADKLPIARPLVAGWGPPFLTEESDFRARC